MERWPNFFIVSARKAGTTSLYEYLREDIFNDYNKENFEKEFKKDFVIRDEIMINESERIIYSMEKI